MAARVPLPKHAELPETILFHRDAPADPVLLLQIPNADRTDAETHIINLERAEDGDWLERLPRSRELRDLLTMEQHVSYCPGTGYMKGIADLDTPTDMQLAVGDAHLQATRNDPFGNFGVRFVDRMPLISRLRAALSPRMRPAMGQLLRRPMR